MASQAVSRRAPVRDASRRAPGLLAHAAPTGLLLLVALWPAFAFTGEQVYYVASCLASGVVVADLVRRRSRLVLAYLAFLVGLIGTEVSGALGAGAPPLGSLRLLDFTMACAMLTVGGLAVRRHGARGLARRVRRAVTAGPWAAARRAPGVALCVLLVAYCVVLWGLNGAVFDSLLKTDVRLVALATGTWLLARSCDRGGWRPLALAFCALGPLCFAKALAIRVSGLWTIGPFDRLQASILDGPEARVILLGGDTILILVPAVAALATTLTDARRERVAFVGCAAASAAGLVMSGTRTSILVAGALGVGVAAVRAIASDRRTGLRVLGAAAAGLAVLVAALVVTGVATRFVTPDAEHVGVNFRKDELRVIFDLPARDLALGQGLAGSFTGKDVMGRPVVTGWSHAMPAWVVLKAGIPGLIAGLALLAWFAKLAIVALRMGRSRYEAAFGLTLAVGMLVMSLTLNRVGLPEGAVLFTLAVALVAFNATGPARA